MLSQLLLENNHETTEFLQWILPRVNYKKLADRLKYCEDSGKVTLFEYRYPSKIRDKPSYVDILPCGSTVHELLTNNFSIKNVMDKLFCHHSDVYWYTRQKIDYHEGKAYPSPDTRQVVLIIQPKTLDFDELKNYSYC